MGGLRSGTLQVAAEQATARGGRGVVLAASPLAAARGSEVMRNGGNAFDAAVVAALIETVVLPSKCGLAGDLVALCLRAGRSEPESLLAIGGAAAALADAVRREGLAVTGPLSVGVPGAPAGYAALGAFGSLPFERLVAPAIEIAEGGFVWPAINVSLSEESIDLVKANNPGPNRYFPDWRPLTAHSLVHLPGLARLLSEFSARGAKLFSSETGERVATYVAERGGVLEVEDFSNVRAEWTEPTVTEIAGRKLWATPAPTHGPALLEAMSERIGGSEAAVWERVQTGLAAVGGLGDPSGTSIVSAADREGNVVVIVHSNSYPRFGAGLVVPELDLILSNRAGRGFTGDPGHPNFPSPGRRPTTTLHAWAVSQPDGVPWLMGGTPGGENQVVWNTQLLCQLLAGEDDPGILVVSPRWEWKSGGAVVVEDGFDDATMEALRTRANGLEPVPRWGLRSAFQVIEVPRPGQAIVGAVDPRTGGAALPV